MSYKSQLTPLILKLPFSIMNANSPRGEFAFIILNAKIDEETKPATMRHPYAQPRRLR
jgi:hypothetical protein